MVMLLRSTRKIRFLTLIADLPPAGSALVDIVDSRRQARGHTHNELGDHRRSRARPKPCANASQDIAHGDWSAKKPESYSTVHAFKLQRMTQTPHEIVARGSAGE